MFKNILCDRSGRLTGYCYAPFIDVLTDDRQHRIMRGRRYPALPLTSTCSVVCQSYKKDNIRWTANLKERKTLPDFMPPLMPFAERLIIIMKNYDTFFRKFIVSSIIIVVLFFSVNLILFSMIILLPGFHRDDTDLQIEKISDGITGDNEHIVALPSVIEELHRANAFAMIIDNSGKIIWDIDKPRELPDSYTLKQISDFSKWFLDDYPVSTYEHPLGLLVIGYAKDSIVKYNLSLDKDYFTSFLSGCVLIFLINSFIMVLLFWRNTLKIKKSVTPILSSISAIGKNEDYVLPEEGEFAEICKSLNRVNQQVNQKELVRAEWISGISHDTRTPLSVMLGYAKSLADDPTLPANARKRADIISRHCIRLRNLIADLNVSSKLEYSLQPVKQTIINLAELLRVIVGFYYNEFPDSKYTFGINIDENCYSATFCGDESLLTRMFENIIQNSILHNADGCNITLDLIRNKYNQFKVTITDNGCGLAEDFIEKLNSSEELPFSDFGSLEAEHGLGLRLVKQIAKAHSISIRFSNKERSGLIVELYFTPQD